jgi:hypothetical protein
MATQNAYRFLAIACVLLVSVQDRDLGAEEVVLHVSPNGNDRAAGSADAPVATPNRALELVAGLAKTSPESRVQIVVGGGVYRIENPLVIGPSDMPPRGSLTFTAASGQRAVISGGKRIAGWSVNKDGSWSAPLSNTESAWSFRELFVAGVRRPRARHPNTAYARIDRAFADKRSGFTFQPGDLPEKWTAGGELVFLHDWSTSRIPVQSVEHDTRRLTVAFPIGNRAEHYKIDHFEPHPRYCVEGHRAFLDAPGEWLLDENRTLTYWPLPGEQPDTTEVVAPYATQLVRVAGNDDGPVRNVHFRRLEFEHSAWQLPPQGYAGSQATAYENRGETRPGAGRNFIPAAIQFERAEDCSFTLGRIAHLGTSGIQFGSRTYRCRLADSVLEDISANGVNLGEDSSRTVAGRPWWQAATDQAAAGHVVEHNKIVRCGQQFYGAVAVWVGLARQMRILNNEIAHHPYTGVSLGWMWNPTPTPAGENLVAGNYIHHVMQVLSDGGGIYTLGRQPGTRLTDNVIHDVPLNAGRAESNGMFLDEGSDQIEIESNVIYSLARSPLRFHKAQQLTVRGNTLVTPTPATTPLRYNNTKPETIRQIENRVLAQTEFDPKAIRLPPTGPRADAGR